MRLTEFPGAAYLETSEHRILFGTFSEVHQHIKKAGLAFPDLVVCGDNRIQAGVPQLVPEFLFFGFLFIDGHFDFKEHRVKEPFGFAGTPEQCAAVRSIMEVSYLGVPPEILAKVPPEQREMLLREGEYFALKNQENEVIPLDDYLRFLFWREGKLRLDGLLIEKLGSSRFRVHEGGREIVVDLSFEGEQDPIWPLPEVSEVKTDHPFSLRVLGAAGPFQTEAPSSSYLLTLNGDYYLIDCAPFTHRILERLGISTEQIRGIVLTHVHDDHAGGLPAFLQQNKKIELISTLEILSSARIKLAAVLGVEKGEIEERLREREVVVGQPMKLGGATLHFHYACHSIPTIGITIASEEEQITMTGDTAGRRTLEEMRKEKVITPERFESLTGLSRANKVLVDCGEALIHGYPQDYLQVPDTRNIILAHREDLPPEYEGIFTLAHSMQLFPLKFGDSTVFDTAFIGRMLSSWGVKDLWHWVTLFAVNRKVLVPKKGTSVLEEEMPEEGFVFLITHGFLEETVNGEKAARLEAGDCFGEQAILGCSGRIRVTALSPVRLLAIPGKNFEDLLEREAGVYEKLRRRWEK
ncbi:MAG TPA: MBL fold metallo-hydrolase [Chroococcales cyanobacterium]